MSDKPRHPVPAQEFLKMIPSSASRPKAQPPPIRPFTISVQIRNRNNRWTEMVRLQIWTDEPDLNPLSFGLKENYRIIVREGYDTPPENADER